MTFLVAVVVVIQLIVPHFLPAIFTTIARPFWRMEFSINAGSLRSPDYLLNQNEALKRQVAELSVRLQTSSSVMSENDELKALLRRPATPTAAIISTSSSLSTLNFQPSTSSLSTFNFSLSTSSYTLAAVLRRPPIAPYDELVIDLGDSNGLSVGNLVYGEGNVLLGRVSDTLGQTSKVLLFSSPGMTYDVMITDANTHKNIPAVAHGLGGGQFSVQVPRDVVSNVGDIVIVPSINNKTIGIVGGVITDPAQPFESILFTSLVNIYDLKWVMVDIKPAVANPPPPVVTTSTKNAKK